MWLNFQVDSSIRTREITFTVHKNLVSRKTRFKFWNQFFQWKKFFLASYQSSPIPAAYSTPSVSRKVSSSADRAVLFSIRPSFDASKHRWLQFEIRSLSTASHMSTAFCRNLNEKEIGGLYNLLYLILEGSKDFLSQ